MLINYYSLHSLCLEMLFFMCGVQFTNRLLFKNQFTNSPLLKVSSMRYKNLKAIVSAINTQ